MKCVYTVPCSWAVLLRLNLNLSPLSLYLSSQAAAVAILALVLQWASKAQNYALSSSSYFLIQILLFAILILRTKLVKVDLRSFLSWNILIENLWIYVGLLTRARWRWRRRKNQITTPYYSLSYPKWFFKNKQTPSNFTWIRMVNSIYNTRWPGAVPQPLLIGFD